MYQQKLIARFFPSVKNQHQMAVFVHNLTERQAQVIISRPRLTLATWVFPQCPALILNNTSDETTGYSQL